jgi:sortase A
MAIAGAGLVAVFAAATELGYEQWQERQVTQEWQREVGGPPAAHSPPPASGGAGVGTPPPATPGVTRSVTPANPAAAAVFALWVPKLDYYAAVRQGVSTGVLAGGPGHYPTTAWPGQPGTVGVAAHNTFWIAFDRIKAGDEVVLQTRTQRFDYRVTATRIVSPNDRTLFLPTTRHVLTLTTCWPLWAGALAGQRLAIVADQT